MSDTFDINSLTPDELQMLQLLLMQSGGQAPGVFGGGLGPSLDQAGIDQAGFLPVNIPQFTAAGKLDPFDLTQQQQRFNLGQDYNSSLDDPITAALGGLGAVGPDAFTPTYDYGEALNMKGRNRINALIDRGGYQGFIADMIMNHDMGPAEAAQLAISTATKGKVDDPNLSAEDRQRLQSLQASLPLAKQDNTPQVVVPGQAAAPAGPTIPGGRAVSAYDENRVMDEANKMFDDISSDPTFAYQDPTTGNYYNKTPEQAMVKTDMMKAFDKMGIPYLNKSYADQDYVDRALQAETGRSPEQQEAASTGFGDELTAMEREHARQVGELGSQQQQYDQMTKQFGPRLPMEDVLRQRPATAPFPGDLNQIYSTPTTPAAGGMDQDARRQRMRYLLGMDDPTGAPFPMPGQEDKKRFVQTPHVATPPPMDMPIYVDAQGNVVNPMDTYQPTTASGGSLQGGRQTLEEYARSKGLTKREANRGDQAALGRQLTQSNQAYNDFYKQRSAALDRDPNLDRIRTIVRASELAKAGRTPARDALMQRQMALRAMMGM